MRLAFLALVATLSGCGITEATVVDGDFSLSFDGDDCVVAEGSPETIGISLTVEAWVWGLDAPPQDRGVVVSMGEAGALWASPYQTGFGKPGDFTQTGWDTDYSVFDGQRHHVAAVWTLGEDGHMFFDGIRSGYARDWSDVPGFDTIRIGCAEGNTNPFVGIVDEVRISTTVRYATSAFKPSDEPFEPDGDTLALYHLDLGTGDHVIEARDQFPGVIHGATWTNGLLDDYQEDTGF